MKVPLIFLFALTPVFALSQKMAKFFYNKQWELTTRDSATYVRMAVYDTLNHYFAGPVTDMFISGKPQMKGYYKAQRKEGDFTFYYENGVVEATGRFENNRRVGPWTFNYPNGQLKAETVFETVGGTRIVSLYDETRKQLVKDGTGSWYEEYTRYNEPGKVIVTGTIKKYSKDGEWVCKLSNGQLLYSEEFNEGEFVRGFTYPDGVKTANNAPQGNQMILPFKFFVTEGFHAAPNADFNTYPLLDIIRRGDVAFYNPKRDSLRKEIFTPVDESATPPGGMVEFYKFVAKELNYPPAARRQGIQGNVFVQFVVEKDGTLTDIDVYESPNIALNAEAIRVVKAYAAKFKWTPGKQRSQPVRQRMVMPISFKLG